MIEERFLLAAVNIRKTYLKLTSNLDLYKNKAESTLKALESAYDEVRNIGDRLNAAKKEKKTIEPISDDLLKIISDIEEEGSKIEKFVEPLNKEIESLAVEEQELYRNICNAHKDLSENQIIDIVRKRLEKENLL